MIHGLRRMVKKSWHQLTPRRHLDVLEMHVTHACNLTCESCSHYSNQNHSGDVTLAEADEWMGLWSTRLAVGDFRLLGGEPAIHPDLPAFVEAVRRHWPQCHIRIVTNGFFLHRHPDLPATIAQAGNADIVVSIHHDSAQYREWLRPVLELIGTWQSNHGIPISIRESHGVWTRRYHGLGAAMLPFEDDRPRQSWEICPARRCKQLFEGQIWKCAPLAYLPMQHAKYGLPDKWRPYLAYRPLDPSCSNRELDQFLALEDEPACSMCPAERRPLDLPVPMRNLDRQRQRPIIARASP
jgi:hypothetical protein